MFDMNPVSCLQLGTGASIPMVTSIPENGGGMSGTGHKRKTAQRELQDDLAIAAAATQTQTNAQKRLQRSPEMSLQVGEQLPPMTSVIAGDMMKSPELQLMTPLLNFLQLLCENHNIKLQVRTASNCSLGSLNCSPGS